MAHFMGTLQGATAGVVSRLGGKAGGVRARVQGWQGGCSIRSYYDEALGCDCVRVELVAGSNGAGSPALIYDGPLVAGSIKPATWKAAKKPK